MILWIHSGSNFPIGIAGLKGAKRERDFLDTLSATRLWVSRRFSPVGAGL